MFARVASFVILALPIFVAAGGVPSTDPSNQCNTGSLQCCNSVSQSADGLTGAAAAVAAAIGPITVPIGVSCAPITAIGVSGTSCSQQPVCCTNNSFNGVIALGCTPINVNV